MEKKENYVLPSYFVTRLLIQNWTSLCEKELKWIEVLDYCELMQSVGQQVDKIPADLHEKLSGVVKFLINNKVENEDHLMEFIKKFSKNLRIIDFRTESLPDEVFFERLADSCFSSPHLDLSFRGDKKRVVNYDFVLNFKNLIGMKSLRWQLSKQRNFIKKLFERFDTFELQNIENGNYWIRILRKDRHSPFEYKCSTWPCQLFDKIDDMMKLHDRRFKSGHYDYYGSIDSDNSLNSFSSTEDILKNFSTYRNDSRRKTGVILALNLMVCSLWKAFSTKLSNTRM